MLDTSAQIEIPDRALFKAAEVCDLLKVQPYVLRSWESEFPDLGVTKADGVQRVYRRTDVEQVQRIKHLLLVEGLTLAGARRKLQDEAAPTLADTPAVEALLGRNVRERLVAVKDGLRSILSLLAQVGDAPELHLTAPPAAPPRAMRAAAKPARSPRARQESPIREKMEQGKPSSSRGKRSA